MMKNVSVDVILYGEGATKANLPDDAKKIACYAINAGQALQTVADTLPVDETGKVRLNWDVVKALIQVIWDAFKKTLKDCAGREVNVKLPPIVALILGALGLRL
jgi:hypothetical protein